jgi:hypothetical protein
MRPSKKPIFDNCRALGPDGNFLFHCTRRKADAYLKHGSAEIVTREPLTIRLLFTPGGPGVANDPCLMQPLDNRCVVCGADGNLTKHHIVPYCYRRWFPNEIGYLTNYDVMALCMACHEGYEARARQLKRELERESGVPPECYRFDRQTPELARLRSHANALLMYLPVMPPEKVRECLETVRAHYDRPDITRDDLVTARGVGSHTPDLDFVTPSRYVVSQLKTVEEVDAFAVRWREHFLKTMRPRFMPSGWTPHRNANGSYTRADRGRTRHVVARRPTLQT